VHSIAVRTKVNDTLLRPIRKVLPFLINLREFALINNTGKFLVLASIQEYMEKINSKLLESITLTRVSTSKTNMKEILYPQKALIKKIRL
jgi:hypothetical protein